MLLSPEKRRTHRQIFLSEKFFGKGLDKYSKNDIFMSVIIIVTD